jgi:integrase/recombinase XerD
MRRTVAPGIREGGQYSFSLYGIDGARKYLNRDELRRALAAMKELEPDERLCALTLAVTGARISEVLALTPRSFQTETSVLAVLSLKRRNIVWREIPIPRWLMAELDAHFEIAAAQHDPARAGRRLWPQHRVTAWRTIKQAMMTSQITGRAACPRGLRHSFGVGTLQSGAPLNLVQRWLGHSRISTTAIYTAACGPEEIAFAKMFWRTSGLAREPDA